MRQRAVRPASRRLPFVQHLRAQVGQQRVGGQRAVAAATAFDKRGEVAARRLQLRHEGRARVAHRHGDVRHDLAGAPALTQRRRVPDAAGRRPPTGRPGPGTRLPRRRAPVPSSDWSRLLLPAPGRASVPSTPQTGRGKTRTRPGRRGTGRPRARRPGGSAPRCGRAPSSTKSDVDPHARARLGPRQQLGRAHLVVDGLRRVLAPVGVVDHHGLEHAAGPGVDHDALARRATPVGPQKCVRWSGSVMQRKTSSRGASKTRVKCSSSRSLT